MATVIRPEISTNNKYYIDKHRYYELKHFCLQYKEWKKGYASCCEAIIFTTKYDEFSASDMPSDLTAKYAIRRAQYGDRIKLVEKLVREADDFLYPYLLKAVTEGLSYTYLKTKLDMPCGRDMYYDRYRKFFWLLSEHRN